MTTLLDIVNDHDQIIGQATFKEAHENRLLHRFCRVLVFNSNDQVVLHQRSATNPHFPLVWDCAGGHIEQGESYKDGAIRELHEEMGLINHELTYIGNITCKNDQYKENMIGQLFITRTQETEFVGDHEVEGFKSYSLGEVFRTLEKEPLFIQTNFRAH